MKAGSKKYNWSDGDFCVYNNRTKKILSLQNIAELLNKQDQQIHKLQRKVKNAIKLNDFIEYIDKQVDKQEMDGVWVLQNGERFSCDVGYVCEWWWEFGEYLKKHKKEIEKELKGENNE